MALLYSQTFMGGKLSLILGPMMSGKTSSLISELTRYVDLDIPVAYINSEEDTRGDFFSTHNSSLTQISPKIKTLKTKYLLQIDNGQLEGLDVIAIDEAQFFGDLLVFVKKWLKKGKIIYVAGLDGDIEQKIFGDMVYLIPYATEVKKLTSVCEICRKEKKIIPAPFTLRKKQNMERKAIGGKDLYYPVCNYHLFLLKELFEETSEEEKPTYSSVVLKEKKPRQPKTRDSLELRMELDGINYIK
jgi:thymidine kinase